MGYADPDFAGAANAGLAGQAAAAAGASTAAAINRARKYEGQSGQSTAVMQDPMQYVLDLLNSGQTEAAMNYAQQYLPNEYAAFTSPGSQGLDYDLNGQLQQSMGESPAAAFERRARNFISYGGNKDPREWMGTSGAISGSTLLDIATGLPIGSASDVLSGKGDAADFGSILTGVPIAAGGEAAGAVGETLGPSGFASTAPGGGQQPYLPNDPRNPEYAATQAAALGLGNIDPNAFRVERVTEPWVSDAAKMGGDIMQRGLDYQGPEAPTISTGSPEALAQYEAGLARQRAAASDARVAAAMQANLGGEMAGTRDLYLAAARGEVPSVAQLQMQAGVEQAQRQALGLAKTARDPGAFYRAQRTQGNLANDAVRQAALLRAQEMESARAGLTNYYGAEAGARAGATSGAAAAAGAAAGVTQAEINRLAQEIGVSTAQAQAILQAQQQEQQHQINLLQQGNATEQTRLQGMAGAAAENRAVQEAAGAGQTLGQQTALGKYQTDVGAATTASAMDKQTNAQREAALWGAAGTGAATLAGAATAGGGMSDEEKALNLRLKQAQVKRAEQAVGW